MPQLLKQIKFKNYKKKFSYELENIFNLSRYLFYLIAIFHPITKKQILLKLNELTSELQDEKIKLKFIDASNQILVQKNRIEKDIDSSFKEIYSLSDEGHHYVYEKLLPKLNIINEFSDIRLSIMSKQIKKKKKNLGKELKLLELE